MNASLANPPNKGVFQVAEAVTFTEVLLHQLKQCPNLDQRDVQLIMQAITMLKEAETTLYGK